MSKATKLADLPLVTSLGSSDTILATDSAGSLKRIAFSNAVGRQKTYQLPSNAGSGIWVRICTVTAGSVGHIFINTRYGNIQPQPMEILYFGTHSSVMDNARVYNMNPSVSVAFPKMRVVHKKEEPYYYLELFVKYLTASDWIYTTVIGFDMRLMPSYTPGSIPEGYTAKEFDITKSALGG